jgi:hypothetical protein
MEVVRITHVEELFANEKDIKNLFLKYAQRIERQVKKPFNDEKKYASELIDVDVFWQNCVLNIKFGNYYFYLIRDNNEWVGFFDGFILKMGYFTIFYEHDIYIPGKGKKFALIKKYVGQALGVDEFWGEATERIYRSYRLLLKEATIKRKQMVMVRL